MVNITTMKKIGFIIMLSIGFQSLIFAQNFTKKSDSDPKATTVLDKLKKKFTSYKSMETNFSLEIEMPGQDKITQKGKLLQKGDSYRLETPDQNIISDGEAVWIHLKEDQEVQITDAEESEEEGFITPKNIYTLYETGDFVYHLQNEQYEKGRLIQNIEFKPLARDSEFFKIRLVIDKKKNSVVRMKIFSKDGSKYTLVIHKTTPNKSMNNGLFVFNAKNHPDVNIEDLRL